MPDTTPHPVTMESEMSDEPYEALVAAMAFIDAASDALEGSGIDYWDDWRDALHSIRNEIDRERIDLLGNGQTKPWHVSDLPPLPCNDGE